MQLSPLLLSFGYETKVWLAVTDILGGAAAVATGHALARAWKGRLLALWYTAIIAAAACFLAYALFHIPAIPMQQLFAAVLAKDWSKVATLLSVWAVAFVQLSILTLGGWKVARARMMREQYGFLLKPAPPSEQAPAPVVRA